ncbi:MAG: hypothetical protein QXD03_03175 [Candidatus Anstonellales archaeon]
MKRDAVLDIISKAIIKMIPSNRGMQLFYAMYMSLDKVFDSELVKGSPMCVTYNKDKRKFELHISTDDLLNIANNPNEVMFILIHECLHIILKHIFRLSKCQNRLLANLAADHIINKMIFKDIENKVIIGPEAPGGIKSLREASRIPIDNRKYFIIDELIDDDMTFEEVYEYLNKNDNNNFYSNLGDKFADIDIDSIKGIADSNEENQAMSEIISEIKHMLENMPKSRGDKPGSILEAIKKIIYPKIPYEELLERAIRTVMLDISENRSWIRYQKKLYSSSGIIVPGFIPDETINKVIIAIDTSGSMSDEDISKGIGVIKKLSYSGKIQEAEILYHDTELYKIDRFKCEDIELVSLDDASIRRGGTSHKEVFDYIENHNSNSEDDINLCIFFTDYYSDIEEIWNKYNYHNLIPTIFVITSSEGVNPSIDSKFIFIND